MDRIHALILEKWGGHKPQRSGASGDVEEREKKCTCGLVVPNDTTTFSDWKSQKKTKSFKEGFSNIF